MPMELVPILLSLIKKTVVVVDTIYTLECETLSQ